MFVRKVKVECIAEDGAVMPCSIAWIDDAMRNCSKEKAFDDTLPVGDGVMEVGNRVPLEHLECAMEEWFLKKGYVKVGQRIVVREDQDRSLN